MHSVNRFVAMIALEQPTILPVEPFVAAYKRRFPDRAEMLLPAGKPSVPVLQQLRNVEDALTVNVGGTPISIISVGGPLPTGTLDHAIATCRLWPDAAPRLSAHAGHIIVAALEEAKGYEEAINSAGAVMSVVSVLCDMAAAIGVYWATGETVTPAQRFQNYTDNLLRCGAAPIEMWVAYLWLDGPSSNGCRTLGVMTTGMFPFIGREFEFLPTTLQPRIVADRLTGAISYVLTRGLVLRTGDTLGQPARSA